ncbi:MAG: hypothetical protein IJH65_07320 [Methanobrevibacter sp.]|nr:hypothetical protein [Methanobrevibacter sp.]
MSFTIIIQQNTSPKHKLTKSLTTITTLTGTLREDTSIIDPVIRVQASESSLVTANYCTISSFGRSYFITDIRSLRNGIIELSLHCDVLSSFASQIKSNQAIIYRQENQWNLYLNDGVFKSYQNPQVITRPFPNGFNTTEFVLAVAGS